MQEVIEKENIKDLIYEIRGQYVMLDSDLGKLYNVETKRINEAVKNNPEKFPERFSWRLTDDESKTFLVENFDQKIETRGGKYKNPRVFTEQGVAMLSTILHSKVAIETSIKIMDAFVAMRHIIGNNEYRLSNVETKLIEHDNKINLLEDAFDKLNSKKKNNEIYFNGQIFDANFKINEIFNEVTSELVVVDSYADIALLNIIKKLNVKVIIITKPNSLLTKEDIFKYNSQYNNLKVIYNNTFHDRYFILDKSIIYHCGTSINRIGHKTFSINLMNDDEVCNLLINRIYEIIK